MLFTAHGMVFHDIVYIVQATINIMCVTMIVTRLAFGSISGHSRAHRATCCVCTHPGHFASYAQDQEEVAKDADADLAKNAAEQSNDEQDLQKDG